MFYRTFLMRSQKRLGLVHVVEELSIVMLPLGELFKYLADKTVFS